MSMIGKTLGTFECTALLGKGGMGEVYRAKDQKLGRDVAIKVLPEEFAKDADRVARFQREAKLLASLNHPNIASIYGLEESDGTHFLVLELIEGDTLADRLKRGAIPVEESLKLALQIAEALEAAHEKGVIHRDLKPANIKVTPDGKVKVLDFGLAKAFAGDPEDMNLSNSPTLSEAATLQGVILGTAAYMSPEQAKGKTVDRKTDIWAFGAVLYEMLTGKAAFQGDEVSEILASVIKGDTNLDLLPANIHPRVREVIIRCLQKDLKKRYRDIGEAQYEIEQVLADPSGVFVQIVTTAKPRKKMRVGLPWVAAALILGGIIVGVAVWKLKPTDSPRIISFDHHLLEGQQFRRGWYGVYSIAVSPDHSHFVYGTTEGLYIRSLDQLDAKLIPGTDGISVLPFFSPDGQWVGYWSDNKIKKIAISGGAPIALCDVSSYAFAIWCKDNTIVYGASEEGIMRVSADGGTPETLIEAKDGGSYSYPQMLPDGKAVLFSISQENTSTIYVQSLESGERKELLKGSFAQYFPTGHIVYLLEDNLFAVPFDVDIAEVTGGPVSLVEGVANYDISNSGTLMYIPGTTPSSIEHTLVWVDREGKEEPLAAKSQGYTGLKISPDGEKVALQILDRDEDNTDIWIWDFARETLRRLTSDEAHDNTPLWTPDGERIVFSSAREGENISLYWKKADGTGKVELLTSIQDRNLTACSWSENGNTLLLEDSPSNGWNPDIGALSMEDDHEITPLLHEEYSESDPKISPDGRWMAYNSYESGESEIYVRPFPDIDTGIWLVSTNGGHHPLWSPDGKELFYLNGNSVMAAVVEVAPTFKAGKPETLFQGNFIYAWMELPWDIHPDGQRFLMMKQPEAAEDESLPGIPSKINIVLNWFEELKDRVPVE